MDYVANPDIQVNPATMCNEKEFLFTCRRLINEGTRGDIEWMEGQCSKTCPPPCKEKQEKKRPKFGKNGRTDLIRKKLAEVLNHTPTVTESFLERTF